MIFFNEDVASVHTLFQHNVEDIDGFTRIQPYFLGTYMIFAGMNVYFVFLPFQKRKLLELCKLIKAKNEDFKIEIKLTNPIF